VSFHASLDAVSKESFRDIFLPREFRNQFVREKTGVSSKAREVSNRIKSDLQIDPSAPSRRFVGENLVGGRRLCCNLNPVSLNLKLRVELRVGIKDLGFLTRYRTLLHYVAAESQSTQFLECNNSTI